MNSRERVRTALTGGLRILAPGRAGLLLAPAYDVDFTPLANLWTLCAGRLVDR